MPDSDDPIHYSEFIDLHYSPANNAWFACDYETDGTTNYYATADELARALDAGTAVWED